MRPNSHRSPFRLALEGAKFAEDGGHISAYNEAVFKAQWQEDKDIGDLDTLVEIAAAIGLDAVAFRQCLISGLDGCAVDHE